METNRIGKQTLVFKSKPEIISTYATVGPKEGEGPMSEGFDTVLKDDKLGQKSYELAESKMLEDTITKAIKNAGKKEKDIDVILTGDLLNQLMSSTFAIKEFDVPFLGLYGACSTMTESLLVGSILIDGGYANVAAAAASSHFSAAERQFRMPLEHGNQRPTTSQWTVTGCGAAIIAQRPMLSAKDNIICVTYGTIGKIIDMGVKDVNLMGAAMAPAAVDTMSRHLSDLSRNPEDYDLILTGDLGVMGKEITLDMMNKRGIDISAVYDDCGAMMFSPEQDTHCGGSGCGCAASIFCGSIMKRLKKKEIKRVMLVFTGAMTSLTSSQQRQSIPGIAHAVSIECKE